MTSRRGLSGGQYKPLSDEDIAKIDATSLRVFSEIGVQVNFPDALELFRKAGATIDRAARIAKFDPKLVQELIELAPSVVHLYGRADNGSLDCEIGGTKVYMGTGGTALNVLDPGEIKARRSGLEDIKKMARLVDALDNVHFYMLNVFPNDLPVEQVDVNRFGAALNRTRKHVMGGVYTVEGVRNVIRMAEIIAGSPEKLRQRPFISMVTCNISPFKLDESYGRLAMEVARHGIPVVVPAEPLCGATAPITLAGNLVVQNVDSLMGVMLTQLVNPGTPVLYGCISSITDLRDMKYLAGAVEMGLMNAAAAQMARFYKLPLYSTAGMSDAKSNDAQTGYESAITGLLVALAGGNFIHDAAGFLEFCMTASYDKLVIDNEIIGMVMRAVEGIRVDDDTLAFEALKKAGPGGHFVSSRHTRKFMRTELYNPQLSDRSNRDDWERQGSKPIQIRAAETVREILGKPETPVLSAETRSKIRDEIQG
ncbi:MAG: trimethylamine methyltransferase family protein, partial [Proteobacteria bacterium]|nr:trimethylamine methyltransferase family protein [Pseudomonadota bacterium]